MSFISRVFRHPGNNGDLGDLLNSIRQDPAFRRLVNNTRQTLYGITDVVERAFENMSATDLSDLARAIDPMFKAESISYLYKIVRCLRRLSVAPPNAVNCPSHMKKQYYAFLGITSSLALCCGGVSLLSPIPVVKAIFALLGSLFGLYFGVGLYQGATGFVTRDLGVFFFKHDLCRIIMYPVMAFLDLIVGLVRTVFPEDPQVSEINL